MVQAGAQLLARQTNLTFQSAKQKFPERRLDCFVAEFIIGPAKGRTRWLLAMTGNRQNKNEQAIRVSPNRLLVEDLTAFGYPRPAPLLAAGDHVFFEDRTAGPANRSALIYLFSSSHIKLYLAFVIPGCASSAQTRNPVPHSVSGFRVRAKTRAPE
jgi:hypothetical protein